MTGRPRVRSLRFPIDPIERFVTERSPWAVDRPPIWAVAELVGVTPATVSRWRTAGLSHDAADRAAVVLGRHPVELWPDWLLEVAS